MNEIKIRNICIHHFRGISNELSVDLTLRSEPESALIFGDNGSGKSSIVDAIEYVTQGSIHGNQSGKGGDWVYNSISLTGDNFAEIKIQLSDGTEYNARMVRNIEEYKVDSEHKIITCFRYAPFILRRQDILNFWQLPNQQKLKLFLKYVSTNTSAMISSTNECVRIIEEERLQVKTEKRALIEEVCKYYKINSSNMLEKNKGDFFAYIKLLNKGKSLKQLDERHPQYNNFIMLCRMYDKIAELNHNYRYEIKKLKDDSGESVNGSYREKLQATMLKISPLVTEAFKKISRTNDYVREIDIMVASKTEMSLEFVVRLDNGSKVDPVMLFSEANRDLLALLIYFEFIFNAEEYGQAKVLILDDIFQSVDSTIRFRVMQYVIERFNDWQIIISTHDRLWKEQLVQLFRNHTKSLQQMEIVRWSFEQGPQMVGSINNFDEKLLAAIENGSTADICASAGYLLEYMCEKLSCILSTSIKRKYGDKYTIGDLWPGIYKELKKTPAKEVFSELNDLLYLRNMVGSHYNEWSLSLSRSEANDFAETVLDAYFHVCCQKCGRWIKNTSDIAEIEYQKKCCRKSHPVPDSDDHIGNAI